MESSLNFFFLPLNLNCTKGFTSEPAFLVQFQSFVYKVDGFADVPGPLESQDCPVN